MTQTTKREPKAQDKVQGQTDHSDMLLLGALTAIYAVVYALFFPKMYTSDDESAHFGMAFVLRHWTIHPESVGYYLAMDMQGPHGSIYRFPIGFPIFLSMASHIGVWAMFLVNPILHILATYCFALTLRRINVPTYFALFYLLYPPFVLFDRTIFADAFTAYVTTIGLYFVFADKPMPGGAMLGLGLLCRASSSATAWLILVCLLIEEYQRGSLTKKPFSSMSVKYLLGFLPFFILNCIYNVQTMGSPFTSTYNLSMLSFADFKRFAPLYFMSFMVVYPLMLLAPFAYKGRFRVIFWILTIVLFTGAASYHETTRGDNAIESLLAVPRQELNVVPILMLTYCSVVNHLLKESVVRRTRLHVASAAILMAIGVIISYKHQEKLHQLVAIRNEINETIPPGSIVYANKDAFKLHQPIWDQNTYRSLPVTDPSQIKQDLANKPVFVVMYLRNRGFAAEDKSNQDAISSLSQWQLSQVAALPNGVKCMRIVKPKS